ncbi:hypothetical protein [Novosphingobium sp. CECT 9465]|uniref:hypothetical protein n=1 Tax=Novosphingobium sp. CECT 9465 TaxID=2829794 RepID=UPI001E3EA13E|nr:hypothetical protein [Novosphingobium sp. CECT 9465]CAH0496611.1 hypothetical protein NVSP9465_01648 [Novosphingobium sp. CECT 9465]
MTKLVSQDDYDVQRADLERAISHAEAEYHSSAFKAQTGAGDDKGTKAAKDHLDALNAALEGLHAAWSGSQQARKDGIAADRDAAFAALTVDVDKLLKARAEKLASILQAAQDLAAAVNAHVELTRTIRAKAVGYRSAHASKANLDPLFAVLSGGFGPYAVAGSVLSANGIQTSLLGGDRFLLGDRSAAQLEERQHEIIRAQVASFAPKTEG